MKKSVLLSLGALLLLVVLVPHVTHAETTLVEKFFWGLVNVLFGWMVMISGMLLDYSINAMVVGFGQLYAQNGLGLTIDTLWVTVRDIFNLTFIFGLVFIGLRMIFGSDSNTKKLLINIILAALLVNFSLFITKFVVDFSNIAATQLVNSFELVPGTGKPSISSAFMKLMGITGAWDFSSNSGAQFEKLSSGGSFGYIFGMMIIFIITTFVFLAGSFLLIIRFVVLNIYMVLSPIMFIGWVFPSMAKYSSEYWSGFLSRCFVAPAYILMLYFTQKVLTAFSLAPGQRPSLGSIWGKDAPANFEAVFPPFVLTAVFLIASVVVAQKMSATGGSAVISLQNKLMNKTKAAVTRVSGGIAGGTAAFAGRQTIGRASNRLTNSKTLQRWSAKSGIGGVVSREIMGNAQIAAKGSYDVRNVAGLGKTYGLGGGNDKGYMARKAAADKKRKEREIKFGNSLGTIDIETEEGRKVLDATRTRVLAEEKAKAGSPLQLADSNHKANDIRVTQTATAVATKEAEIAPQKTAKEAEIARLETELKDAKKFKTKDESDEVEKKLNTAKAELDNIEETSGLTALKEDAAKAQANFATSQATLDNVMKGLETQVKSATIYANQIQYAKTIQGKADFWNKVPIIRNNHSFGRRNKQLAKEMTDYYGEYGQTAQSNILKTEQEDKESLDKDRLLKDMQKFMKAEAEGKTKTPPPTPPPTT